MAWMSCLVNPEATGPEHHRRKCKACKAFYMRRWRRSKKGRLAVSNRWKKIKGTPQELAKRRVFILRRSGKLKPPCEFPCADCGRQAEVYDHRDYSRPADVEAVCRSCNVIRGPAKNHIVVE